MKKIIFLFIASIIVIPLLVWLSNYKTNFPVPDKRTDDEFISAIKRANPRLFFENGEPIFTIIDSKKPIKKWYVLRIVEKGSESTGVKSTLIIRDPVFDSDKIEVVSGPVSKFSNIELDELEIPLPVKEVIK